MSCIIVVVVYQYDIVFSALILFDVAIVYVVYTCLCGCVYLSANGEWPDAEAIDNKQHHFSTRSNAFTLFVFVSLCSCSLELSVLGLFSYKIIWNCLKSVCTVSICSFALSCHFIKTDFSFCKMTNEIITYTLLILIINHTIIYSKKIQNH